MKKLTLLSMNVLMVLGLAGCKLQNPELTTTKPARPEVPVGNVVAPVPKPPEAKPHQKYVQDDELNQQYNPKADILFVMDTSDSMLCDQRKLEQNIDRFVDGFMSKQGRFLDFHIGAVSVWDSALYGSAPRDCEIGELRPVGGGKCSDNQGKDNFVTRQTSTNQDQLKSILAKTLKVGIEPYIAIGNNPTPEHMANRASNSGPETEELFSPVLAALSENGSRLNPNFRRTGVPLHVVFVSDTDDRTPGISGATMAQLLRNAAGENTPAYGHAVLARYNDLLNFERDPVQSPLVAYAESGLTQCRGANDKVDPLLRGAGMAPVNMREFLVNIRSSSVTGQVEENGFDLADANYGDKLANLASNITRSSLRKVINLHYRPDIAQGIAQSIVVKYGTQTIPKNDSTGWTYVIENHVHKIVLNEGLQLEPEANARITIEYTPVL